MAAFAHAVHDPDTVMVMPCYTTFAQIAMFTPCGFEKVASAADLL